MIHTRCSDCGQALDCHKTIKLWENMLGIHDQTGQLWCPECLLLMYGAHPDEVSGLHAGLVCWDCGGAAGYERVLNALRALKPHLVMEEAHAGILYRFYRNIEEAQGAIYPPQIGTWGGRAPRVTSPKVIKLEPGEVRCQCNNCERLLVSGAGA